MAYKGNALYQYEILIHLNFRDYEFSTNTNSEHSFKLELG